MKTVHKFILKSYLGPMVLTFFIVMFVLIMQFMWRYIDELVGKGLDTSVIFELMMYAAATLIPMGLPLATLLAAIMTMGNLGENYELLALKSAGMSLPRIMKPLTIVIGIIAVASFFVANNLVPYSTKKIYALIYDIRQQKQSIEFKDGIFFNGIDNMSIRVDKQHPETKLLTDILIYDTRDLNGNMTTTLADSGYIRLSDDKKYLLVTLYNGQTYEETRNYQWFDKSALRHHFFTEQNGVIPLSGFDFERTDTEMFNNSQTKNIAELTQGIDSLEIVTSKSANSSYEPLLKNYIFTHDKALAQDTVPVDNSRKPKVRLEDSIAKMDIYERKSLWEDARITANNSRSLFSMDEQSAKEALNQLYRYKVEWHRKMSLPVSIMIFFLIGAPLGAIIRKGGLGMPIVVSVLFFVIYYIISITGEKLAREGSWGSFAGMWISTFILLPISIFLTYKATNDSNLFNAEWYIVHYRKLKAFLSTLHKRKK
ncbi:LptF/LptG family permease [Gallalistipes aquisgranensis]|uniref:LptF/LptG family permease n=1 Tax=Gallalistipes aquisgranensis TaxID=2779358 RepID=UPI001CF8EB57|nr:LptF/LptG family permease [Gallalistipes aquisgranensis]MBE5033015.1 LptF/LptG family permease [Gallalistipes aquisgranensis]